MRLEELREGGRDLHLEGVRVPTGLEKDDRVPRSEPFGEYTTGRSGTDDHIVSHLADKITLEDGIFPKE